MWYLNTMIYSMVWPQVVGAPYCCCVPFPCCCCVPGPSCCVPFPVPGPASLCYLLRPRDFDESCHVVVLLWPLISTLLSSRDWHGHSTTLSVLLLVLVFLSLFLDLLLFVIFDDLEIY